MSSAPRYILGIDLGTTNCSAAWVDSADASLAIRDLLITQIVAPGTVERRPTLPSFHYEPAPGEFAQGAMDLPWAKKAGYAVGLFARDHGAAVPGRQISSAKSWLCHSGIDRTAAVLPWHGAADTTRLSPVEVSARYLAHIRGAWETQHPDAPLAEQDVVLTVPASFDEVARELTVEAARAAGFSRLVLLEEPQAAFYAWISGQGEKWAQAVEAGQTILVADVGGGTTDLTLIRVERADAAGDGGGNVLFHRIAVGPHLLLGGDNLDLALAAEFELRLAGGQKLPPAQWGQLLRACRNLKETILLPDAPASLTLNLSSGSSRLIGSSMRLEVSRDQVRERLLSGFLPEVGADARPAVRRSGFVEFNLPYAADAGITRYLAAFLASHGTAGVAARPDLVLFNGGFFASPILRERLLGVLGSWFGGERPRVLENDRLDLAVSRGAAYYGLVRRGHGTRITGGLAHSYYIGIDTRERNVDPFVVPAEAGAPGALCLLPAGTPESVDVVLEREFDLLIRTPVEFPLYVSAVRTTDRPGALVTIDGEQMSALPPIRTVLQSGKKSAADTVRVKLLARLTPIGTLELWAQELKGERQWRLQFDVRSATRADLEDHGGLAEARGIHDASVVPPARSLIRQAFGESGGKGDAAGAGAGALPAAPTLASLVKRLELLTGQSRADWTPSLLRSFWEVLNELEAVRRRSMDHESRYLSLLGFCLRPGFGMAVDDWRVAQTWRLTFSKLQNPKNEQCRAEWHVLWRRVAGGLSAGQQTTLAEPLHAALRSRLRPAGAMNVGKTAAFQFGPAETAEAYRLLGSLELLSGALKRAILETLLSLLPKEKTAALQQAALFAVGRLAARVPAYGPLNGVLSPEAAEGVVRQVVGLVEGEGARVRAEDALFALVQMARRTDDRYRDLGEEVRLAVSRFLSDRGSPAHYVTLVRDGGELAREEQALAFGESLPRGLRIG